MAKLIFFILLNKACAPWHMPPPALLLFLLSAGRRSRCTLLNAKPLEAKVVPTRELQPANALLRLVGVELLALVRKASHIQMRDFDFLLRSIHLDLLHKADRHHLVVVPVMMDLASKVQMPATRVVLC